MVPEIDINRRLLSIAIDCYRLSVYRLTTHGDLKAYWVPLSVQNHSRSCFHVDFVQCDSRLENIYDILKWPCEKNLGLKRCGVANSLSGNHPECACLWASLSGR